MGEKHEMKSQKKLEYMDIVFQKVWKILKCFIGTFIKHIKLLFFKYCVSYISIKRYNFPPKFILVNQKYNKNLLLLLPPFFCFQCLLFFCYSWLISQLSLGAILMEERHNKSTMKKWHDLKKKKNKNEKKTPQIAEQQCSGSCWLQ